MTLFRILNMIGLFIVKEFDVSGKSICMTLKSENVFVRSDVIALCFTQKSEFCFQKGTT